MLSLFSFASGIGSQYWIHRKEAELYIVQYKSDKERANLQAIVEILPESVMLVSPSEKTPEENKA